MKVDGDGGMVPEDITNIHRFARRSKRAFASALETSLTSACGRRFVLSHGSDSSFYGVGGRVTWGGGLRPQING